MKKKMILPLFVVLFMTGILVGKYAIGNPTKENVNIYEKLKIFSDAIAIVQNNYVEDVDSQEVVYGAIKGMLQTLDPHSSFMTPDMFKEMEVD
jgi:carboxyl-terminal processing protease